MTEFILKKMIQIQSVAVLLEDNVTYAYFNSNESAVLVSLSNQSKTVNFHVLAFEQDYIDTSVITITTSFNSTATSFNSTTTSFNSSNDDINVAKLFLYSTVDVNVKISSIQTLFGMNDETVPIGYLGLVTIFVVFPLMRKKRKR